MQLSTIRSQCLLLYIPNNTLSSVSSKATRVCICDSDGYPQCANESKIFITDFTVHPGEMFSIHAITVGAEFGTTTGTVHAKFLQSSGSITGRLGKPQQALQQVSSKNQCTKLSYSVHSQSKHEVMYLVSTNTSYKREYDGYHINMETAIDEYTFDGFVSRLLLTTPIFINITFKQCPPGFSMTGDHPYMYCDCYAELTNSNISCSFRDGIGHISREGNNWVGINDNKVTFNDKCLFEYCKQELVAVKMEDVNDSDSQCAFNHAGILCGGCKEGYSLALGSNHCLYCPRNSKYAALVAFMFAGLMLVEIMLLLDLTIRNGGINGLIFYANIVWAYKSILFPQSDDTSVDEGLHRMMKYFFKIFVASLNLDIGFQTCFWNGMDAFWKSILQFAFPVYIWIITYVAIVVVKYFSQCAQCIQKCAQCECTQRPVKVLVTLILMSYAKLIRTILGVFTFSVLRIYPGNSTKIVWALDGNITYLKGKHAILFTMALVALFVALIYTAYIFMVGLKTCMSLKRENNRVCKALNCCSKMMEMPLPLYDAHFAPFNNNHKYWLGLLLFVRAILLVVFSSTLGISPVVNLPVLIVVTTLLLFYMGWKDIYERKSAWVLQGLSFSNLIGVSSGVLYAELANQQTLKTILVSISIGIAFLIFIGILGQSIIQYCTQRCTTRTNQSTHISVTANGHNQREQALTHNRTELRESLLDYSDDSEPESQWKHAFHCLCCCSGKQ